MNSELIQALEHHLACGSRLVWWHEGTAFEIVEIEETETEMVGRFRYGKHVDLWNVSPGDLFVFTSAFSGR